MPLSFPFVVCPSPLGIKFIDNLTSIWQPNDLLLLPALLTSIISPLPSKQPNRTARESEDSFCLILKNECIISVACQGFSGPQPAIPTPTLQGAFLCSRLRSCFNARLIAMLHCRRWTAKDMDPAPPSVNGILECMIPLSRGKCQFWTYTQKNKNVLLCWENKEQHPLETSSLTPAQNKWQDRIYPKLRSTLDRGDQLLCQLVFWNPRSSDSASCSNATVPSQK